MTHKKMNAIEIRCEFAKAKLIQLIRGESADCPIGAQIEAANELGQHDFDKGNNKAPTLFEDEQILMDAWQEGQQIAKVPR